MMFQALGRYADFSGRSQRAEYWLFMLLNLLVSLAAAVLDMGFGLTFDGTTGPMQLVVVLALLLPGLAVSVRRLHDLDRAGWWLLIAFIPLIGAIVLLVWDCTDGNVGENRFGPDPKGRAS